MPAQSTGTATMSVTKTSYKSGAMTPDIQTSSQTIYAQTSALEVCGMCLYGAGAASGWLRILDCMCVCVDGALCVSVCVFWMRDTDGIMLRCI